MIQDLDRPLSGFITHSHNRWSIQPRASMPMLTSVVFVMHPGYMSY